MKKVIRAKYQSKFVYVTNGEKFTPDVFNSKIFKTDYMAESVCNSLKLTREKITGITELQTLTDKEIVHFEHAVSDYFSDKFKHLDFYKIEARLGASLIEAANEYIEFMRLFHVEANFVFNDTVIPYHSKRNANDVVAFYKKIRG